MLSPRECGDGLPGEVGRPSFPYRRKKCDVSYFPFSFLHEHVKAKAGIGLAVAKLSEQLRRDKVNPAGHALLVVDFSQGFPRPGSGAQWPHWCARHLVDEPPIGWLRSFLLHGSLPSFREANLLVTILAERWEVVNLFIAHSFGDILYKNILMPAWSKSKAFIFIFGLVVSFSVFLWIANSPCYTPATIFSYFTNKFQPCNAHTLSRETRKDAVLALIPSTSTVKVGQQFSVNVIVEPEGIDINAVGVKIAHATSTNLIGNDESMSPLPIHLTEPFAAVTSQE